MRAIQDEERHVSLACGGSLLLLTPFHTTGEVKSWGNSKARDAAERAKWVGWRERWARGDYNMGDTVDEEDYGDRPIRLSSSDTLYQMFPENSTDIAVKYTYDFGDSWIVRYSLALVAWAKAGF